jgi:hypothetical protein
MSVATSESFGRELCEMLGLDARGITKIVVVCKVGEVAKVYITQYARHGEAATFTRRYKIVDENT